MQDLQLEGRAVALWGWGREGRAAWRWLRGALPTLPLTLFCSQAEAGEAAALGDALLHTCTRADAQALSAFEVVVKSPGISPYGPRRWQRPRRAPVSSAAPRCGCQPIGRRAPCA